jgi:hypothetical protein
LAFFTTQKYQIDDDPNYLGRWPWLRDLLPPSVDTSSAKVESNYDVRPVMDKTKKNNVQTGYESNENVYGVVKELNAEPMPIPVAFTERRNMLKERDEKRQNNNYCKLGRL